MLFRNGAIRLRWKLHGKSPVVHCHCRAVCDFLRSLWKRTVAGRGALETVYPGKAFVGDFEPGFSARLARKDLKLAQELGEQYGLPLATGAAAREMFTLQQAQGRIDEDWTALLDVLERLGSPAH
ncbi:MAG: hypothetical protein EBY28_10570 [Betaproteobacteria bacterium]|nr:hypothetical protein [Betaproteobacteria bacterium]